MRQSRRRFVQGVGVAGLGLLAGCGRLPGQAQDPPKVHRIGWLVSSSAASRDPAFSAAFRQGLGELGYVEGQNIIMEYRYAEGEASRLPKLAAELVALPVDVILTAGVLTAEAARDATGAIPIVMVGYPGDPVASALVASLSRPGGNVTGMIELAPQLAAKRLELLKEAVPSISRVAVIRDPDLAAAPAQGTPSLQVAAETLGVQLQLVDAREPGDLDAAFEAATQARADAVFWGGGRAYRTPEYRSRVVALAAQHRLPAMYGFPEWVEVGALMAYSSNYPAQFRRAAYYVDRILKGTRPADLPIEQPREFEFVINLRTAQALGLSIPPHVLLQATEVIQ